MRGILVAMSLAFFAQVSFASSLEVILGSPERTKTTLQDFSRISQVANIADDAREGYRKRVEDLESLAERSIRWRIVDINVDAFGEWYSDRLVMNEVVAISLFSDVELSLRMPKSKRRLGDLVSFSAGVERDGESQDVPNVEGFIWESGALEIPTLYYDESYYSITPLVNFRELIPKGKIPHLIVQFDPEVEYTRKLHAGDVQVEIEYNEIDPRSISADVPASSVMKPESK